MLYSFGVQIIETYSFGTDTECGIQTQCQMTQVPQSNGSCNQYICILIRKWLTEVRRHEDERYKTLHM